MTRLRAGVASLSAAEETRRLVFAFVFSFMISSVNFGDLLLRESSVSVSLCKIWGNTMMNFCGTWLKIRESVVFSDLIRGFNRVKSGPRPSCFRKRQVSSPACPRGVSTDRGQKMLQHIRCQQRDRQRTCSPLRTPPRVPPADQLGRRRAAADVLVR